MKSLALFPHCCFCVIISAILSVKAHVRPSGPTVQARMNGDTVEIGGLVLEEVQSGKLAVLCLLACVDKHSFRAQ